MTTKNTTRFFENSLLSLFGYDPRDVWLMREEIKPWVSKFPKTSINPKNFYLPTPKDIEESQERQALQNIWSILVICRDALHKMKGDFVFVKIDNLSDSAFKKISSELEGRGWKVSREKTGIKISKP